MSLGVWPSLSCVDKKMKMAQNVWKVCKECVRVCERVCESVWKYHQCVFKLIYILLDTQLVEIGWKMAKIAQSVWRVCEGKDGDNGSQFVHPE